MANGLRLAYDEFGDSNAPAIVLIMGLGAQMIAWPEVFCQSLAGAGFRVIRYDNRDIGLSQKINPRKAVNIPLLLLRSKLGLSIKPPYTLKDMARDAIGVIDFLGIDKAHWVGASMGGMIAQIVTSEYPQRSLSLTSVMSSSGNPQLPQASWKITKQLVSRPDARNEKAYLEHSLKTWGLIGSPDYPPTKAELTERILGSLHRSYSPKGYQHQAAAILESGDRRNLLKKIKRPTLVIHGKEDKLALVEAGIDTAKHIDGARLKLIEGMGHDLPRQLIPKLVRLIVQHVSN